MIVGVKVNPQPGFSAKPKVLETYEACTLNRKFPSSFSIGKPKLGVPNGLGHVSAGKESQGLGG